MQVPLLPSERGQADNLLPAVSHLTGIKPGLPLHRLPVSGTKSSGTLNATEVLPGANVSPFWRPSLKSQSEDYANSGRGKENPVRISKSYPELSSSTDDLLKLAGTGHLFGTSPYVQSSHTELKEVSFNNSTVYSNTQAQLTVPPSTELMSIGNLHIDNYSAFPLGVMDMNPSSYLKSATMCRYFMNGYCSRGDRCNYSHTVNSTPNHNASLLTANNIPNNPSVNNISNISSLSNISNNYANSTNGPLEPDPRLLRLKYNRLPASYYTNLTIDNCLGDIFLMCLDQHGCRFLQKELDKGDPRVTSIIFLEVIDHVLELSRDPFGNYLCQKLIEHSNQIQRVQITQNISSDIVRISKNMHGTRAVQTLIHFLDTPTEIKQLRDALKGSVVELIQDTNGNHVIQKCLHRFEPNDNQFIYDVVAMHCVQVATHRHGCCVFQRCLDRGMTSQNRQLVEQLVSNAVDLVQDAFGNYVVQYALEAKYPNLVRCLVERFQGRFYLLAKQKFSSNVIEKCIKLGDEYCVQVVMRELLSEHTLGRDSSHSLLSLLQDSYGNYVVQTCLFVGFTMAPKEYRTMVNLLSPYVNQFANTPYGKRMQSLMNGCSLVPPSTSVLSGGVSNGGMTVGGASGIGGSSVAISGFGSFGGVGVSKNEGGGGVGGSFGFGLNPSALSTGSLGITLSGSNLSKTESGNLVTRRILGSNLSPDLGNSHSSGSLGSHGSFGNDVSFSNNNGKNRDDDLAGSPSFVPSSTPSSACNYEK